MEFSRIRVYNKRTGNAANTKETPRPPDNDIIIFSDAVLSVILLKINLFRLRLNLLYSHVLKLCNAK